MNRHIDRESYLAFARCISLEEKKLIEEYQEWLPDTIIDCHAHCNLESHVCEIKERAFHHMLSTFPSFSLEESNEWNTFFHPDKKIFTLRFPGVAKGINHKEANSYLLRNSPKQDRIALFGLSDDIRYTINAMQNLRVSALKMYHSYPDPPATQIYEFFPKEILALAEKTGLPIILHPPFPIADCIGQVVDLVTDFPKLKICLAHLGLTKSLTVGFEKALVLLAQTPFVFFDTALVSSADVVEAVLKIVGVNKVMYGSDAPVHLIRSTAYQHPQKGRRLVTQFPYHWVDKKEQEEYGHLAKNVTHDHWKALMAIKQAIKRFPYKMRETIKNNVFFENAKIFYGF